MENLGGNDLGYQVSDPFSPPKLPVQGDYTDSRNYKPAYSYRGISDPGPSTKSRIDLLITDARIKKNEAVSRINSSAIPMITQSYIETELQNQANAQKVVDTALEKLRQPPPNRDPNLTLTMGESVAGGLAGLFGIGAQGMNSIAEIAKRRQEIEFSNLMQNFQNQRSVAETELRMGASDLDRAKGEISSLKRMKLSGDIERERDVTNILNAYDQKELDLIYGEEQRLQAISDERAREDYRMRASEKYAIKAEARKNLDQSITEGNVKGVEAAIRTLRDAQGVPFSAAEVQSLREAARSNARVKFTIEVSNAKTKAQVDAVAKAAKEYGVDIDGAILESAKKDIERRLKVEEKLAGYRETMARSQLQGTLNRSGLGGVVPIDPTLGGYTGVDGTLPPVIDEKAQREQAVTTDPIEYFRSNKEGLSAYKTLSTAMAVKRINLDRQKAIAEQMKDKTLKPSLKKELETEITKLRKELGEIDEKINLSRREFSMKAGPGFEQAKKYAREESLKAIKATEDKTLKEKIRQEFRKSYLEDL